MDLPENTELDELLEIVEDPLRWAETFLIEPTSGKPFKANYVERKILSAKGPWVVLRIPRRQGKSYSLAILALWAATTKQNYTVLVLGPGESHVTNLFDYIRNFLSANPHLATAVTENTKSPHRIRFSNGSMITGRTTGSGNNKQAISARGLGANMVIIDEAAYLKEADFAALSPIFTNDYYVGTVRIYAASTPTAEHGRYYLWNTDPSYQFEVIHVPITDVPEITPERLALIRATSSEQEWIVEHMAEFPDIGDNVFRNTDIDKAKQHYTYTLPSPSHNTIKIVGVDWDKYSSGVNIVVIEASKYSPEIKLAYREEIPRSEYTLTDAIKRIIQLNAAIDPDYIFIDRGYGESQIETLKLYGKNHPESGMHRKVIGIQFNENVDVPDPVTGEMIKKQFKSVMLNTLAKVLEDGIFKFSDKDTIFERQLRGYKILSTSGGRIQTTRRNEHIIDAVGLAIFGLYDKFRNELKSAPAEKPVLIKRPEPVKSPKAQKAEKELFRTMAPAILDRSLTRGWSRGTIGDKPLPRKTF
jgi:hypothetical protein